MPRKEGNFDAWIANYVRTLVARPNHFFISEEEQQQLIEQLKIWDEKYAECITARDAARAAVEAKDEARAGIEDTARETIRRIQADGRVTDAARRDAGLPVHKTTRTPLAPPTTAPRGQVIDTDRLEHTVTVYDSKTPTKKAKPHGVVGCEVFLCIADTAPTDPAAYTFKGVWTRSPERVAFKAEDAGKIANYLFRWLNSKGQTGPWSEATSATIPAV